MNGVKVGNVAIKTSQVELTSNRGLHSATLALNLSTYRTHSRLDVVKWPTKQLNLSRNGNE